ARSTAALDPALPRLPHRTLRRARQPDLRTLPRDLPAADRPTDDCPAAHAADDVDDEDRDPVVLGRPVSSVAWWESRLAGGRAAPAARASRTIVPPAETSRGHGNECRSAGRPA